MARRDKRVLETKHGDIHSWRGVSFAVPLSFVEVNRFNFYGYNLCLTMKRIVKVPQLSQSLVVWRDFVTI